MSECSILWLLFGLLLGLFAKCIVYVFIKTKDKINELWP